MYYYLKIVQGKYFCRLFFLTVLLGALASAAELPVTGDAQVNSAYPGLNYGSLPYMQVGGGSRGYLQFDLSTLPAGLLNTPIARVNLVFWVGQVGAAGSIQVSEAGGAWTENSITYGSQPSTTRSVIGTVAIPAAQEFVSVDVTAAFTRWLNTPSTNFGFVLDGISSAVAFVDSKESVTTSHAAMLEIAIGGPIGATGATGLAGSTGVVGPTGAAGPSGATGSTGAVGPTRAAGPSGATGATGVVGPTGAAGPSGSSGATGAVGPTGAAGPSGATG
jgi:hypothetical protein